MSSTRCLDWALGLALLLGLPACSPAPKERPSAPTGRYEGTLTYRGAELPVVLSLAQDTGRQVVQVSLLAPGQPLYSCVFDSVVYRAPALTARLPGGPRLALREEPNFLTGTVWLNDTLRAELVAVRRGSPDAPAYTLTRLAATAGQPALLRFEPLDTARRRTAVLLWPAPDQGAAAYGWAGWLARQGTLAWLALPGAAPDSVAAQQLSATLRQLRLTPAVDSARVGVWATGSGGRAAALAAVAEPGAAFMVVQGSAFAPADRPWLRKLSRRPVPVLGLYGGRDTSVNVPESSQQLRNALGRRRRGAGVKVYEQANRALLLPAAADSVPRWPQLPPDLLPSLQQWLSGLR